LTLEERIVNVIGELDDLKSGLSDLGDGPLTMIPAELDKGVAVLKGGVVGCNPLPPGPPWVVPGDCWNPFHGAYPSEKITIAITPEHLLTAVDNCIRWLELVRDALPHTTATS
jgi:hypothetical protein